MNFELVFSFWARTAPVSLLQRLGALFIGCNSVLCSFIIASLIFSASANAWSVTGFTSSAVGLAVILLILPTGIAHGLAAIFPNVYRRWLRETNGRIELIKEQRPVDMKKMYLVVGWLASIGIAVLLTFFVTFQLL